MALQKVSRSLLNTGVADSSDATAITIDSSENVTVTGTLAATLSTAAQPNITSVGTLTALTGGTGDLNWDSGTLFVDSSANAVGIGTTSPYTPLEVAAADSIIRLTVTGGVANKSRYEMRAIGASGYEGLEFRTANDANNSYNVLMHLDYDGNVGIGATSPGYPLEISSTATVSLAYQRTGFSCKKWGFNSDNSFTYWMNLTDNVLALSLSNAGLLSTAGGLATTQTTALALDLNGTHSGGNYIAWKKAGAAQFYIGSSNTVGAGSGYYDLYAISGYGLRFFTGAAQRWSINTSGHFTPNNQHAYDIGGTNAEVRNVYAQGISFASNANASGMTSELLDDYEEGNFTPIFACAGGTAPSSQTGTGQYTKIGDVVHITGQIAWNGAGNGGSNLRIAIPFNVISDARAGMAIGLNSGLSYTADYTLHLVPEINTNVIYIVDSPHTGAGHNHLNFSNVKNTGSKLFSFSGSFHTRD